MVLSAEYTDYAIHRKTLRVSWPKGSQRLSYYLTLPYKYSVPLLSASAVLHWLLSQSIFYVRIDSEPSTGGTYNRDRGDSISVCGYSPIAIIATLIFGGLMTLAFVLLGMRKYKSPVPLAGNCSAAISAACHPPANDRNAAFKPVMWGEVATEEDEDGAAVPNIDSQTRPLMGSDGDRSDAATADTPRVDISDDDDSDDENVRRERIRTEYGHCCFASKEVVTPSAGRLYI